MRTKRATDQLADKMKDLIIAGDSSGSEHGGDDDSPSLSDVVHGFLFGSEWPVNNELDTESYSNPEEDLTNPMVIMGTDPFRNKLLAHVYEAMEMFSSIKSNKLAIRRSVMGYLREKGYNAAICKTRWESSGGLTAGSHEFIDVTLSNPATSEAHRYFIEIDFAAQFEIARPTSHYERVSHTLPMVFIGTKEELKLIVKAMSDSAKRSLKSKGLSLPPWRKNRFMQNKWFGPYKRTVNLVPLNFPTLQHSAKGHDVTCRCVGFDAVNGGLGFPATTRTR